MPQSHLVYGQATADVEPFNTTKRAAAVELLPYVTATVCDRRNTAVAVEMFEATAAVANVTEA